MAKKYHLTAKDRAGFKKMIQQAGAGKGPLSRRPLPGRRRPRGGGGGGEAAIVCVAKTSEVTPAATESGGDRTPGELGGEGADVVAGSAEGDFLNYSLVEIPADSYIIAIKVGGDMVIIDAFC